jgi:hypothetical protein
MPELVKALLNLAIALVSLAFTWLIGHRLTAYWAVRQRRKELALMAVERFHSHYGEFCAIWKLWDQVLSEFASKSDKLEESRRALLDRATNMEAGVEATLLKVASEQLLSVREQAEFGNLRQAFQVARERIRDSQPIAYWSSEDPHYTEFKRLACAFGTIVGSSRYRREPSSEEAAKAFSEITSNKYEGAWRGILSEGPSSHHMPPN